MRVQVIEEYARRALDEHLFAKSAPTHRGAKTLAETLGAETALSKLTVSRICAQIQEEFETWRTRDLSGLVLDYLFLDASHLRQQGLARAHYDACGIRLLQDLWRQLGITPKKKEVKAA